MSDKRRHADPKEVRKAIINSLMVKSLQAKDLQKSLKKHGLSYSRDRLNDLLNMMMDSGDIERVIEKDIPYPVYSVLLENSKILAEINGITFQSFFKNKMFVEHEAILKEFKLANNENKSIKALLEFFGFYVLGSLIASRMIKKDQRAEWLKQVLDLEEGNSMSLFLEQLVNNDEEKIKTIAKVMDATYQNNMKFLKQSFEYSVSNHIQIRGLKDKEGLKQYDGFLKELKEKSHRR